MDTVLPDVSYLKNVLYKKKVHIKEEVHINEVHIQEEKVEVKIIIGAYHALREIPLFNLISWCRNFVERHSFHIVSGESPTPEN